MCDSQQVGGGNSPDGSGEVGVVGGSGSCFLAGFRVDFRHVQASFTSDSIFPVFVERSGPKFDHG